MFIICSDVTVRNCFFLFPLVYQSLGLCLRGPLSVDKPCRSAFFSGGKGMLYKSFQCSQIRAHTAREAHQERQRPQTVIFQNPLYGRRT